MPQMGEVGNAAVLARDFRVEWKVDDFFSLSDRVNDFYSSPAFSFAGKRWCLLLYPNGLTAGRPSSEGWIDLCLRRLDPGFPQSVLFTFGIRTRDGRVKKRQLNNCLISAENVGYGYRKCWTRSELRDRKAHFLPEGAMTVTCDLRSTYGRVVLQGNEHLKKEVTSLKEQIKTLQETVEKCELESENYKEQVGALESEKSSIVEQYKSQLKEKSTTVSRLEKGNEQLEKEVEYLKELVMKLQRRADKYEMESKDYKEQISASESEKSSVVEQYKGQLKEKLATVSRLEKDNNVLGIKIELLMGEIENLHKTVEEYKMKSENYEKQISASETQMPSLAEPVGRYLLKEKSKDNGSKKVETLEPVKTPSNFWLECFKFNPKSCKTTASALQSGLKSVIFHGIFFFLLWFVMTMP